MIENKRERKYKRRKEVKNPPLKRRACPPGRATQVLTTPLGGEKEKNADE